ncbi:MAG: putative selenate reductase subunit YgfK [Sphaerochaetaceae bacterium]
MSDIMRPVPFAELVNRIVGELRLHQSIFGIPQARFYTDGSNHTITVFGRTARTAVGPAAGPHTQLAQNIITGYLVGSRFVELKTCQQKDDFASTGAVQKPCIDATDEGYNVEWSTEYTLSQAWDEYAKAYIVCCLLDAVSSKGKWEKPSFVFNMSVGYTLDGIKTKKMQTYIDAMLDGRKDVRWNEHIEDLKVMLSEDLFHDTPWEGCEKKLAFLPDAIDSHMVNNVTISTMHGCPPKEIEAICTYMLTEKHIHTYVKLNPTLLGYDEARRILDANGFGYVHLKRKSFEKDLQWKDAVAMLHRLSDLAKKEGKEFGVKLTNTLGSSNDQGRLPGDEMYMSGRSLYPLSVSIAANLSREFGGRLPISYCGGVNWFTAKDLFECGLRPLTVATDMLRPGGYEKLAQIAKLLEGSDGWDKSSVDVEKLEHLAKKARSGQWGPLEKSFREEGSVKVGMPLPLTDCYIAPCQMACPIHQPIPEYVQLCGEGRYADALALIYDSNPLPGMTGWICDHQCQNHCTRNDYEGPVQIREMKKIALQNGFAEFRKEWEAPKEKSDIKAVVVGAGPAGLAAAFFLARSGFDTTVLEREKDAGGVVRHVIPGFRIPEEVVAQDVQFVEAHGVVFRYGVDPSSVTVDKLKEQGYSYIFYAIGAEKDNEIGITGDHVLTSLDFLGKYRGDPASVKLGRHVVVAGGGNTAMDSARAAKRIVGVESVTIVYRRTENEMPAAHEELENCLAEGIAVEFLANPVRLEGGKLLLSRMRLGEKDASGRGKPVDSGETFFVDCDTLITAIGEKVDSVLLSGFGLPVTDKGWPVADKKTMRTPVEGVYAIGDAQSGPSSVVRCIASAKTAVDDAIDAVLGPEGEKEEHHHHHDGEECCCDEDDEDEEDDLTEEELVQLTKDEDAYFADLNDKKTRMRESKPLGAKDFAATEAKRCMECSYYCNKCVDVCPNRANVAIDVRNTGMFDNPFQILHLDAYCNECGNCETFCPYDGGPYRKKFTLFSRKDDFEHGENDGFCQNEGEILIRQGGKLYTAEFDKDGTLNGDEGVTDEVAALIETIYETYGYLLGPVDD